MKLFILTVNDLFALSVITDFPFSGQYVLATRTNIICWRRAIGYEEEKCWMFPSGYNKSPESGILFNCDGQDDV